MEASNLSSSIPNSGSISLSSQSMFQWNAFSSLVSVKLDSSNYLLWRSQIESVMFSQDLIKLVDGSCPAPNQFNGEGANKSVNPEFIIWKQADQLALSWIKATIDKSVLGQIIRSPTSKDAWIQLEKSYASQSSMRILQLKRDLQDVRKGDLSMVEYLNKVRFIADALCAANEFISDDTLVHHTLNGLSTEYESFITSITTMKHLPTFAELYDLLLNHEKRLQNMHRHASQQVENSVAFFSQRGRGRSRFFGGRGRGRQQPHQNNQPNNSYNQNQGNRGYKDFSPAKQPVVTSLCPYFAQISLEVWRWSFLSTRVDGGFEFWGFIVAALDFGLRDDLGFGCESAVKQSGFSLESSKFSSSSFGDNLLLCECFLDGVGGVGTSGAIAACNDGQRTSTRTVSTVN
ncbi:Retrovirus-related Pol polyprotein from transposon TNT 1-94 [Nymphaea thermarum]|nr:Retrovirus-related Pol polyprotein from transposon TNT 1-94 [Nymphaea thermarum]